MKKNNFKSHWEFWLPNGSKIFVNMRLTLFLFLISLFSSFANISYSQSKMLTMEISNSSVREVLSKIEKESEFKFMYSESIINANRKVSISVKDQNVEAVLNKLFVGTDVEYTVKDRMIILSNKNLSSSELNIQQLVVKGKVTDGQGEALPGVTVVVKGTTNGSITDFDGNYSLSEVPSDATLVFSFIGMRSKEIQIDGKTSINIVLEEETIGLEEVVAIGYGTTKRKNFTGSVATVNIEDSPSALSNTTNVMNLLRGIAPGVSISQSGEAGEEPSIIVRGQKSITGGSDPLYIVDGVIFSGSINDLDPNNIESMSVLKDATTLAAYGSKAANGVVMITTKKGKLGKPVINFNSSVSLSTTGYEPKTRNGKGYIKLMNNRSGLADDANPIWMGALEQANYEAGKTTNWLDLIDRTGVLQNYSLSFSGASENSNYYFSAGHLDQKGIYYGDDYARNTFSANVTTDINDFVKIGANTTFGHSTYEGVSPSYSDAITLSPFADPFLSDGKSLRKFVDAKEATTINPLWDTYNGIDSDEVRQSIILGGYLNIDIPHVDGLSFKVTGSYTLGATEGREFTHETNSPDMTVDDSGYTTQVYDKYLIDANGAISNSSTTSWVLDNILTYTKQINKNFINTSLVYTRNSSKVEGKEISGSDFTGIGNTVLGFYGLNNAEVQKIDSYEYTLHNDVGYLARASYSYDDTYHLNVSTRYDGSSVFGTDKKWGLFPAVGAAWTISNERFMTDIKAINNLKLKLSWGKNGNQSLAPYGTLSTITMGRGGGNVYYFDNVAYGQKISALGNSDLGWESTTSVNYGFETDLWKHLHIELDGYKSQTTDQIFSRNIPVMGAGLTSQLATMGQVDNWGIEANVRNTNIEKGDFSWVTSLVFSMNRNKLVELYGDGEDDITSSLFLGESLGAIYGYKWNGVVQAGEENYLDNVAALPGDAKYADVNDDGNLTAADREILGFSKENFRMSMSNTFIYKNLELYILLNGIFSGNRYGMAQNNSAYLTADTYFYHNTLDHPYYTSTSPNEAYPRYDFEDSKFVALQSYGFVRLQDLNLAYTFKSTKLNNIGVNGLKVYMSCSNLLTFAPNWEGSDPEIRSFQSAQLPRTFKFGLNLKF